MGSILTEVLSSVSDRKRLNPQDRSKTVIWSSLAPLKSLLMPFTGLTDAAVYTPWWFDRVDNKSSVKGDLGHLAIYSYMLGISR